MTDKEKAQAYDEALERAKKYNIDDTYGSQGTIVKLIFPELQESDDETIRKEIINFIYYKLDLGAMTHYHRSRVKYWIKYLEKQKEQKDYRKLYEDIAQSDWFKKSYVGKSLGEEFEQNEAEFREGYLHGFEDGQKEQNPAKNVSKEEYVKRFKALCDAYEIKLPNREYDIYHLCDELSKLSIDSSKQNSAEINLNALLTADRLASSEMTGRLKERGEILENPEKYGLQKSAEWSEEDDKRVKEAIKRIDELEFLGIPCSNVRNVLESLRNRPKSSDTWKPSEEQMKALKNVAYGTYQNGDGPVLRGLCEQLGKL